MQFSTAMTKDQMYKSEEAAESWGETRRCAYAVLTRSSSDLEDLSAEAVEGFMDVLENLAKYLDWRKTETELLKAAEARMLLVLEAYTEKHPDA